MKIVVVKTNEDKTRYYLAEDDGTPVESVLEYLRFKDNYGLARNTLRMHCIHLKHFFTYLNEIETNFENINIDDLAGFIAWLKNPDIKKKVVQLRFEPAHKARTINANIDTVISFYDYLLRHEGMDNNLSEMLVKFIKNPNKSYRSFLHGIASNKQMKSHILKLPVPRQVVKTVAKEAGKAYDGCLEWGSGTILGREDEAACGTNKVTLSATTVAEPNTQTGDATSIIAIMVVLAAALVLVKREKARV